MKALQVVELVGPRGLRVNDIPSPAFADAGLLVDVHAVGVSFPDLLKSRGEYQEHPTPPYTLGREFAGVVAAAVPGSAFRVGDRVAGITETGAAAERAAVPTETVFDIPDEMTFVEAAALPLNYPTAIVALLIRGRLRSRETLLVHGAAGGTGTAAIQVAKAIGCRTIAVVSNDPKAEVAKKAGADEIVRSTGAWKDEALALTGGRGVDVVFDPVGGDRYLDTMRVLATGGRWVVIGFVGGAIPQVALNRVLLRNIDIVGSYLDGFSKSDPSARPRIMSHLSELLASGALHPIVGGTHSLEDAVEALRELDERRAIGKVVLTLR